MQIKRIMASLIISTLMMCNTITVLADTTDEINSTNETNTLDNISEEDIENIIVNIPDIDTQLDELYNSIADELGVDKIYIKQLHLLAGGTAIYAEKKPDIKNDITIDTMQEPMYIEGANTTYRKAEFIECGDDKIERPSPHYLPDAMYSVAYEVISIMSQRYYCNRGGYQIYYDSLQEDVKYNIAFYEAVLLYTGVNIETVNSFYTAYEKILYDKNCNENVIEETESCEYRIKDKFIDIIHDIGITSENDLKHLALVLSFDKNLAVNDSVETLQEVYNVPYKPNYTSRENMMIAAASLCGKVRYVWGGGHSGASYIDGINPMWKEFESLYPDEPTTITENENGEQIEIANDGFGKCIKPSGSWCPIHGVTNASYHGGSIKSLQEYVDISAENLNATELLSDKYKDMLSKVDYKYGINIHTLDGLDCSGFASWLYNQITDKYELNSTAIDFTKQNGLVSVEEGDEILPGDIFTWTEHIVIVVGKVNENKKAFVTIEQTPNVLKYGVIHYEDASSEDIALAKQIASEANELIGGLDSNLEKPHVYCMNSVGIYTVQELETQTVVTQEERYEYDYIDIWFPDDYSGYDGYEPWNYVPESFEWCEERPSDDGNGCIVTYCVISNITYEDVYVEKEVMVDKTKQYNEVGRFKDTFIDENTLMSEYGKTIKNMTAQEIIQHTITKLPIYYVSGYNEYNGELFDKSQASTNLGINIE